MPVGEKLRPGQGRVGHLQYRQMADRTRPIVRPDGVDDRLPRVTGRECTEGFKARRAPDRALCRYASYVDRGTKPAQRQETTPHARWSACSMTAEFAENGAEIAEFWIIAPRANRGGFHRRSAYPRVRCKPLRCGLVCRSGMCRACFQCRRPSQRRRCPEQSGRESGWS